MLWHQEMLLSQWLFWVVRGILPRFSVEVVAKQLVPGCARRQPWQLTRPELDGEQQATWQINLLLT